MDQIAQLPAPSSQLLRWAVAVAAGLTAGSVAHFWLSDTRI